MKKFVMTLMIVALVAMVAPAFAGQKNVASDDPTPMLTKNGRLAVSTEQLNSDNVQIYITTDGKVISPMPTDPAMISRWLKTQQWLNLNIGHLNQFLDVWRSEVGGDLNTDATAFLNDRLQGLLRYIGADEEIDASGDRTMSMVNGACGPKGRPASQVQCCTSDCDETGCGGGISCHLCDCDVGGVGCCMYVMMRPRF